MVHNFLVSILGKNVVVHKVTILFCDMQYEIERILTLVK